ncbi:MAG: hypothetical protein ACI4NV_08560 [Thermoguttaceae bacterium]
MEKQTLSAEIPLASSLKGALSSPTKPASIARIAPPKLRSRRATSQTSRFHYRRLAATLHEKGRVA